MSEHEKIIFVVTNGEDRKEMLEPPLFLATLAAAIDVEVIMVYSGAAGLLLKKGVADNLVSKPERKSYIELIRDAKKEGVKIFVCSPVLEYYDIDEQDFIEECDGVVGGMYLITESLEAKATYTY
jgi:predicted peroxiredoxin